MIKGYKRAADLRLTPRPVNRDASNLLKPGETWQPSIRRRQTLERYSPFPVVSREGNASFPVIDLTGTRRGRLVCYGYSPAALNGFKNGWALRCDCGCYVLRNARAVKNENNRTDACETCRRVLFLKREEHYRRTGKDKDLTEFM